MWHENDYFKRCLRSLTTESGSQSAKIHCKSGTACGLLSLKTQFNSETKGAELMLESKCNMHLISFDTSQNPLQFKLDSEAAFTCLDYFKCKIHKIANLNTPDY